MLLGEEPKILEVALGLEAAEIILLDIGAVEFSTQNLSLSCLTGFIRPSQYSSMSTMNLVRKLLGFIKRRATSIASNTCRLMSSPSSRLTQFMYTMTTCYTTSCITTDLQTLESTRSIAITQWLRGIMETDDNEDF